MATYNDNNNNECPLPPPEAEEVPKRKVGRPRRDPSKLAIADPDYFKLFYHEKRTMLVECSCCGKMVTKNQISKHIKSMKCRFVGLQKENE